MPALFFAHGAPFLAVDTVRGPQLRELAAALPRKPRGIVAFTPHVRARHVTLAFAGVARRSFPARFRERVAGIDYAPPPAHRLAAMVRDALMAGGIAMEEAPHAGFNHTVWMGLYHMFPRADVPVVEIAMPFRGPRDLFAMGLALSALRENDILVVASGSLTHNLATLFMDETPAWAREFDAWLIETLRADDLDSLLDWRRTAPAAAIAHPDDGGHFNVLHFALGAVSGRLGGDRVHSMHAGWEFGTFSTRDLLLG